MEEFIHETTSDLHKRVIAFGVILILALLAGSFAWWHMTHGGTWPKLSFSDVTPATLFVLAAVGGLFFVPVPIEATFYMGINAGNALHWSIVAVLAGFVIGNIVSYLIGWKLSRIVMALVPAKKLHAVRKKVVRYGVYAILVVNLIPAPSPLLTFGLGIARYNMVRLFTYLILGNCIKFLIVGWLAGGFI